MLFGDMKVCAVLALLAAGSVAPVSGAAIPRLKPVAVDPLVKIFRDDAVKADGSSSMEAARGEHATFQLVVPGLPVDITDLRCDVTTFTAVTTPTAQLPAGQVRYVGYIGASHTAKTPAHDQLRAAPAVFPDPLLEDKSVNVEAGDNQACWITVPVPVDTQPGDYKATSVITAKIFGEPTSATVALSLKVYPATITKTRLDIVNWFQLWHRGDQPSPEQFSEPWWDMLRTYAEDMVAHRQNWARAETLWIIKYNKDANGKLTFDFSNFDRWVQTLLDAGITNIESLQFAWRTGKWDEPFGVETHEPGETRYQGGKIFKGKMVAPDSPEAKEFYSQWFPAFTAHLREKGWLDKFVQHVGDEPVSGNAKSYAAAAKLVRDYAPELPIMEACLAHDMVGSIDIWVPVLQHLHKDFEFFQERQRAGETLWFYTCVQPQGEYANRFLELPLIKTRLLHWINYRYNLTGFLHWGYNFWRPHPWDNASDPKGSLPAGDMNIVYPAKDGYGIIGSIRWEAMRDGIEDHELLSQLGEKDPDAAMALARRMILDFDKYVTDVRAFRQTRHELLENLSSPR
jgi:hypothetical protein